MGIVLGCVCVCEGDGCFLGRDLEAARSSGLGRFVLGKVDEIGSYRVGCLVGRRVFFLYFFVLERDILEFNGVERIKD